MITRTIWILFFLLGCGCKQKPDAVKSSADGMTTKTKTISVSAPVLEELVQFANLSPTDSTALPTLFLVKEIDESGTISEIDVERAAALYKKMTNRGHAVSFPIFEIKNTETVILPLQGVGFGGAIWAKVLVDKQTLEIKKIAFEHKAESDGYGAGMTQTSFENQFVGKKINLEQHSFELKKAMEKSNDDGHVIDGISGATVTNEGIVEMLNVGLQSYRNYLDEE